MSTHPVTVRGLSERRLTPAQRSAFAADGYLAPLPLLSAEESARARAQLAAVLAAHSGRADARLRNSPHLLLRWVSDLARDARLLDAVQDLLGPDLLILRTTLFVKPPRDRGVVAWHQDLAYWDLSDSGCVTAWLALTDSTVANGCVQVVRASHRDGPVAHRTTDVADNRLVRGQQAEVDVAAARVVDLELRAGEMSLHHGLLLHGSPGNPSGTLRAGLAVRCISPATRQAGPRASATLARGVDVYGHFDHQPVPRFDGDPVAATWHRRAVRRLALQVLWECMRRPSWRDVSTLGRLALRRDLRRAVMGR